MEEFEQLLENKIQHCPMPAQQEALRWVLEQYHNCMQREKMTKLNQQHRTLQLKMGEACILN